MVHASFLSEGREINNYSVVTGLMMLFSFFTYIKHNNTINNNAGHRERCFSPLAPSLCVRHWYTYFKVRFDNNLKFYAK